MKKIVFIILLIFSLLIIREDVYQCGKIENDNFESIEKIIKDKSIFINNGIKLEYTITGKCDDEINRIYKLLSIDEQLSVTREENQLVANSINLEYNVKSYSENNLVKVEIVILNKDKNVDITDMKILAQKIENNNLVDERYFLLVKGKISTEDILDEIMIANYSEIKYNEKISINNGEVYKFKFNNGENINASFVTYDTGTYVIIGTPVIFLTY